MSGVRTRFAPSPTGHLHIGGARTALFAWLYARHTQGKFILRIEDTDAERSTDEYTRLILEAMTWLGLDWDEGPFYQSQRLDVYRGYVERLLAEGKAYWCECSPEELEQRRASALAEGRKPKYDQTCRRKGLGPGPGRVVRFASPESGTTVFDDLIKGRIVVDNSELDDLILLRSDNMPTYNFTVVIDDADMRITHCIRGDDHVNNTPRQIAIYEALGLPVPFFAHVPMILGADKTRLSKRHGALGVDAYRALGYLPVALRNYLVRLGWSHGDQEIFSSEEMIAAFDLKNVGRSPARFDFAKLENINGHYMRQTGDAELLAAIETMLPYTEAGPALVAELTPTKRAQWLQAMPGLKERAKTLVELVDGSKFLFAKRPLKADEKATDILAKGGRDVLRALLPRLEAVAEWSAEALETAVRAEAEATGLKLGALAQPLRAALTGRSTSPGIFDVFVVLGREESLGRIRDCI